MSRFGLLLKEAAERERAEEQRRQRQRQEARAAQRAARRHEDELAEARRQLDDAIRAVRVARETRRGRDEADAAWRAAKARVIELETGTPPAWAPQEGGEGGPDDEAKHDDGEASADDLPAPD